MNPHSILPPSSAARRMACPGSRELESKYPSEPSPQSREGEAAHWVASEALKHGACLYANEIFHIKVSEKAINDEIVTQEMIDGAVLYLIHIESIFSYRLLTTNRCRIEEKINISNIHPNCWGTPDFWGLTENTLHVFDYKFGFSFVEVFENWQLLEYAAGILEYVKHMGENPTSITLHIVQPRSYHKDGPIRSWDLTHDEFVKYQERLKLSEYLSMQHGAPCHPSPQCVNCSASHVCQALQESALQAVDATTANVPFELSPEALSRELQTLQKHQVLLEARISGLEQQAISVIKNGERVPGYSLEQSQSRERWKTSAYEVISLGELLEINLAKPVECVTPKQAIKLGVPAEVIRKYSETPPGALKLTFTQDKRKMFK